MTAAPPRTGGGRALVGIGEVMAMLRAEFPDVSISKIRFLEAEGLVEPQRTPSGYRKFGPSDVDRLRYVLRVQRDQYLPLKVIKDHLDAIDRGLEPAEDGLVASLAAADADRGDNPHGGSEPTAVVLLSRAELLAAAGIDEAALARLEEFGLIEPRRPAADTPIVPTAPAAPGRDGAADGVADPAEGPRQASGAAPVPGAREEPRDDAGRTAAGPDTPGADAGQPHARAATADAGPQYDGDALVVARLVSALGEYGLEPRHLRQVKAAADREAALVEQIVAPLLHRRGAGAKSGAEETVRDLLSLTSRLHTVLVGAALRPLLDR
ncbi:transcriptional regulator FtsR [Streptodolium elevatio]|uniref:MerR family transcriptional regulator n=1 Tax=Streptodolium elevatio TaxID=3157996 RepID=A0ABV3DW35_9ACTN